MSLLTFGFGGPITGIIASGLTGVIADAIDEELRRLGRKPETPTKAILKQKKRLGDEYEEYFITAELKKVNNDKLVLPIKNAIIKKIYDSTDINVTVKDISVNHRKNENNEIVIDVTCLTYKQPRKFRKIL